MQVKYIVVQAGGRGSRMEALTQNKPKALVPVENLPMIFHLFKKFPDKKFIIIGDYKCDVLEKYLKAFAKVKYDFVKGAGHRGTCAGLLDALDLIPEENAFMLVWCDLVLPEDYEIPKAKKNFVGISKDFFCRWSFCDGKFKEKPSKENGVAGLFIFKDKSYLSDVPTSGEFVRWLGEKENSQSKFDFEIQHLKNVREYGLFSQWQKIPKSKTRPFNRLEIKGEKIFKIPIGEQGKNLAKREEAWYKKIQEKKFSSVPKIFGYDPLQIEKIKGKNLYEYFSEPLEKKKKILCDVVSCLKNLHSIQSVPSCKKSFKNAYIEKTFERLKKVRGLVPFSNEKTIFINGKKCRNIFFYEKEVENLVMKYFPKKFCFIHGDCTFSNIILKNDSTPILIDPRGYFGKTEIFGDAAYDWAKLYYSLASNYDQFNLKRFSLFINEENHPAVFENDGCEIEIPSKSVRLKIAQNNFEDLEDYFFELLEGEVTRRQMKIFLAVIWLSLTTYAWEDYDSICGAFYNGLFYLEDALCMESENFFQEKILQNSAYDFFSKNISIIDNALRSIKKSQIEELLSDCEKTLKSGHKIIASGLGKNVPICEKFVGTMLSLGFAAGFLHTNSAVHGDMGMIKSGDLAIILTKSGSTSESVFLADLLKKRSGVKLWLLTFCENGELSKKIQNKVFVHLKHEGDLWNIVPNNSSTINLIILQEVAIELSRRFKLDLEKDFKPNHPGGAIGERLRYE